MPPNYRFLTAEQEVAERAARKEDTRPVIKAGAALRAMHLRQEAAEAEPLVAQGFVNYLPPKAGSMVYDSNWLASNTAHG